MSYARLLPETHKNRNLPPPRIVAYETTKRTLDVLIAALLLLAFLPLLLIIALAIRLDSPGPVLFTQWRSGCNGARFRIVKFRSMRVHQGAGVRQARRGDPRVTR
ncbi:sugar transferase, partial [Azospirillum rugosum]